MKKKNLLIPDYKVFAVVLFLFTITVKADYSSNFSGILPPVQDNYWIDSLKIIPGDPAESDFIQLVAFTKHPSGGCDLKDYCKWRWNNFIFVDATYEQGMLTYICSSIDTIELGYFKAGKYNLVYDWRDSLSFSVTEKPNTCKANFGYYYTRCGTDVRCGPNSIAFVDSSVGNIIRWHWDFGDGKTSTLQSPMHQYENSGVYNVCLSITTEDSCRSTFCDSVFVNVPRCKADFTWNPLLCFVPCPGCFSFSDQSFGDVIKWKWDFDDGTSSEEQNPVHCFTGDGVYRIGLEIVTIDGCSSLIYKDLIVCDSLPRCKADFTWFEDTIPFPALTIMPAHFIQFTDHSFGNIDSWYWNFGDGNTSDLQNPHNIYYFDSTYYATLTIHTVDGCIDTKTKAIDLEKCEADFNWYSLPVELIDSAYRNDSLHEIPTDFYGEFIQFIDKSKGNAVKWEWDFGDGYTSELQNPVHVYSSGKYIVMLKILTRTGCMDTKTDTIIIHYYNECKADFTWEEVYPLNWDCMKSTDCISPYFYVQFTPESSGPIFFYSWSFGDGSGSDDPNPLHQYKHAGKYNVCLNVQGDLNSECGDMICKTVIVGDTTTDDCFADFIMTDDILPCPKCYGCICKQFNSTSSWNAAEYLWNFGDGDTSSMQNPSHMFWWNSGQPNFNISLKIKTSENCTDSIVRIYDPELDSLLSDISSTYLSNDKVVIYPNPAENKIYFELPGIEIKSDVEISVFDIFGRKSGTQYYTASEVTDAIMNFDVAILPNGQYICQIIHENKVYKGIFVVNR